VITPQSVRLALMKAGYKGENSAVDQGGFKVMPHTRDSVWVTWRQPDTMTGEDAVTTRADMLSQYSATLMGRGFHVANDGYALTVTKETQ
jgi:hypothetical protein